MKYVKAKHSISHLMKFTYKDKIEVNDIVYLN